MPRSVPYAGLVELEADLHLDLEVLDRAVLDVTADAGDLDPVDVAQGLRRAVDAGLHRLGDRLGRRAGDLDDLVGVGLGHGASVSVGSRCSSTGPRFRHLAKPSCAECRWSRPPGPVTMDLVRRP